MKTNIELKGFVEALETGGQMAGRNRTLPILDCVRLTLKEDVLRIVSFNGETGISCPVKVLSTEGDMSVCVDFRSLLQPLRMLNDEVVSIIVDGEDANAVRIEHGNGELKFPALPAVDFPEFGKEEVKSTFMMDGDVLRRWMSLSGKFVADDELRPVMNCMYLYAGNGRCGFCATDSHGLITEETANESCTEETSLLMHSSVFSPAARCFRKSQSVKVRVCDNGAFLSADGVSLYFRKTAGKFPNFRSVIPTESTFSVKADTQELSRNISLAMACSDKTTSIGMSFSDDGMMKISAEDTLAGKSSVTEIHFEESTQPLSIHMKGTYMLSALSAIEGGEARISFISEKRPVMFTPAEGEGPTAIVMPIFGK
ncbi:MAG: hypothetical protein IAB81_02745 [Bacteroidetes bacterium]|uniref:Beta sliding clamp n=1 Tax=Candidatus Merdivivens pullicola TaxID=2840872 RepID=A0A9D9NG26_9BACT|nr:hypothetical protein [Candidatus Merdivivens pullicola]